MKIGWAFQRNEDGSSQGWNDPSIAEFKSNRLESLTRETIQNSLDAAVSDSEPVVVEFLEQTIKAENIPDIEQLREIVSLCDSQTDLQNPDMVKEFGVAKETIKKNKIPVLSVSDYNTKGMKGPCEPGNPFYQYLKTVGQSGGDTNRAGSHGLGKAAPLACSDLRTIFVSTVWKSGRRDESLVQGRAVLMSFKRKDGIYKSTGYWGDASRYQALAPKDIPPNYNWILREEIGTTVHIIGWNRIVPENWEKLIIGYAISSFFAAFMRGRLVVKVNNYTVDETSVFNLIGNPAIAEAMKKNKTLDRLEDAQFYMRCLSDSDAVIKEETQLIHLGRTSIRLMIAEDAPRKVALIRNNMLITDSVPGFWKKIPGRLRDFVGVVEVLDQTGSQFIRLMEPPSHNSLSKDWLPTADERKKGELVLEKLSDELRKFVERHAGSNDEVFGKVDFMAEFFADEAGDDRGEKLGDEVDPNGNFMFSPKAIKLLPVKKITLEAELEEELDEIEADEPAPEGDENSLPADDEKSETGSGFSGGTSIHNTKGGPNPGEADSNETAPTKSKESRERDKPAHPINLSNVRVVKISEKSAKIFATPSASSRAVLRLHEVGSDFDDPFEMTSADLGDVKDGSLRVAFSANQRVSITVNVSRPIIGGLKIVASHEASTGK
jgi:hypothetical protein